MEHITFERLAPEIISNIVSHAADIEDIRNMRLTNKTLNEHAVRQLFKEAFIRPTEDSVARWIQVADCVPLAKLARRAVIHTVEDITQEDRYDEQDIPEEVEEGYQKAISALDKFPNLDSLLIRFSIQCMGLGDDSDDVMETAEIRLERLRLIFNAIKARTNVGNSPIRSLTIMNLQNQPLPEFTDSDLFHDVMSQLDELHVQFVQEYNEHGPDHDYTRIELQTFPAHFCSAWLAPIAANLRELSLYYESENWGVLPGYFDPSGCSFPKLETLSLGYYTIAYDDQLDWLLSIKSLKKLVMHRCMVASRLRIAKENMEVWKTSTRNWMPVENSPDDWCKVYTYGQTWSVIFEALATSLPNLQTFVFDYTGRRHTFGSGPADERVYDVEGRHDTMTNLHPQRYVVFDNGILPTHWPEADSQGKSYSDDEDLELNFHRQHLDKDQAALDNLLELCRTRQ